MTAFHYYYWQSVHKNIPCNIFPGTAELKVHCFFYRWRTTFGCLWTAWLRTPPLTLKPRRTWRCSKRALDPVVLSATSSLNRCLESINFASVIFQKQRCSVGITSPWSDPVPCRPLPLASWRASWTGWNSRRRLSSTRNVQLSNKVKSRASPNWTTPTMQVMHVAQFPSATAIFLHQARIIVFSSRWEELLQLHTDPHRGRLGQDTCCVWAGSSWQGPLWRLPAEGKNPQRPGSLTQTGEDSKNNDANRFF